MKTIRNNSLVALLAVSFALGLAAPIATFAATAPSLGAVDTYGIVSDTWTNSLNAGLETAVTGGVCYTTPPGTAPVSINGVTVTPLSLAVVPCSAPVGLAQSAALANLNGQACTPIGTNVTLDSFDVDGAGPLPPGTFPPGCYSSSGTMDITLSTTVTLDGPGVYIFRSGGALTTGANSIVALTNGADASQVFWTPGGLAKLGANSSTSATPTFVGTIIADALGSTGITIGHFANLLGRALAFGHTVTTDSNTISVPSVAATLHVIKLVVNGNGGTATASNFNVHVKTAGVDVLGSPAFGTSTPGTAYALAPGTYAISEDTNPSYVRSFTGDCDSSGNITLAASDDKICTIVNTDIPPPAPVPTGGGVRYVPVIGVLKVPTPLALPAGPGSVTYNYTVWNVGGQQALDNVTLTDSLCTPSALLSGDTNGNGKLDPGEFWKYSCTTTLKQTTTNTAIATGYSDDGTNQIAVDTAIATVVVSSPLPPPLIDVVKVPSRLTPFPFGGGNVTYVYTVTNPGVVAMNNVTVTDDKCASVSRVSGDANSNNLLDPGESWVYTCTSNVPVSTRNIATAKGDANGFTAISYAFSTVLVTAPSLPNTGLPPEGGTPWGIVALFGIIIGVSAAIVRALKTRKI